MATIFCADCDEREAEYKDGWTPLCEACADKRLEEREQDEDANLEDN